MRSGGAQPTISSGTAGRTDGRTDAFHLERYRNYLHGIGARIAACMATLEELERETLAKGELLNDRLFA